MRLVGFCFILVSVRGQMFEEGQRSGSRSNLTDPSCDGPPIHVDHYNTIFISKPRMNINEVFSWCRWTFVVPAYATLRMEVEWFNFTEAEADDLVVKSLDPILGARTELQFRATNLLPPHTKLEIPRRNTFVESEVVFHYSSLRLKNPMDHIKFTLFTENYYDRQPTPQDTSQGCGVALNEDRIASGASVSAWPSSVPWQAGLQDRHANFPFCGGAIISQRLILTAANCTTRRTLGSYVVVVGTIATSLSGQTFYEVACVKKHPKYRDDWNYDIALLRLKSPLVFGAGVNKVCLPPPQPAYNDELEGRVATISGWGQMWQGGDIPSVLQIANLNIVQKDYCVATAEQKNSGDIICAATITIFGSKSFCTGDSGGPMTVIIGGRATLVGIIVSTWEPTCKSSLKEPNKFTRVARFVDWIDQNKAAC